MRRSSVGDPDEIGAAQQLQARGRVIESPGRGPGPSPGTRRLVPGLEGAFKQVFSARLTEVAMRHFLFCCALVLPAAALAQPGKGNRLAYLDEVNPYYPSHTFPKLTTPMWVGDKDVEAVVILGIDDMREPKKYETFLRPILRRLKGIDGRAPVSIMTCSVDPKDPQLQAWLKEGLSLECHTIDHPCPFFKPGFEKAKSTYDRCVDLMNEIPNNKPVAFRMPCCDSLNTPSP